MPSSKPPLPATWRYSAIGVTPIRPARRRRVTASRPLSSASASPARSTQSRSSLPITRVYSVYSRVYDVYKEFVMLTDLAQQRYVSLTTFRRDGTAASVPVWVVSDDGERLLVWTGANTWKVKRIRRDPRVLIAPADYL